MAQALETMLSSLAAEVGAILAPEEPANGDAPADNAPMVVRTTWGIQPEHVDQICLIDGERAVDMCHREGCHLRLATEELPKMIDTSQLKVGLSSFINFAFGVNKP